MTKRKFLYGTIAFVAIITVLLIITGMVLRKSEDEKQNGLSGYFDVSKQGTIAYVHYSEGVPEIRLYDPEQGDDTRVLELDHDSVILDPTFSHDGSTITYIRAKKNLEEELRSEIYQINLTTNEKKEIFSASSAITEIELSPDEESLFYLQASVFENYSPIASKRPHDFDVHEYSFSENKHIQHTNLKEYSMGSLNISDDGNSVYVQMGDVADETSEDAFDVTERIFKIPLNDPENMHIVSDPEREVDIWGFTLIPNSHDIIFKSVANHDDGGIFQYELYHYDTETKEEAQLTNLKEYATHPVVIPEMNQIYFAVDKQFGQIHADYHLFKMNMDGTDVKEIHIPEYKE